MTTEYPNIEQIKNQAKILAPDLHYTPIKAWDTPLKDKLLDTKTTPILKLELFQRSGSFKIRGTLTLIKNLTNEQKQYGVVAGTAGNHGISVGLAAKLFNVNAKIVIPETINPYRLKYLKSYNPKIITVKSVTEIITKMREISASENRTIMHPFNHPCITLGTGTLGLEFITQAPDLDAIIVPIGGGGLISGISCAVKQINPKCKIYGVEPLFANSMSYSLSQGKAGILIPPPHSIADSLSAPCSEPYSFAICQKFVDEVVTITEEEIIKAMILAFQDLKLALEPASSTALAGLLGPLKNKCAGLKVGLIICGSNIDFESFSKICSNPCTIN